MRSLIIIAPVSQLVIHAGGGLPRGSPHLTHHVQTSHTQAPYEDDHDDENDHYDNNDHYDDENDNEGYYRGPGQAPAGGRPPPPWPA